MRIEIDQSGKVEDTQHDTIVALSNGQARSVRITGKTKRRLQEVYRQIGEPRLFVLNTFCVAIFLLVEKDTKKCSEIMVDEEYSGHESLIVAVLQKMIGGTKHKLDLDITFGRIGKHSSAHELALKVFQRKLRADDILTFDRIYRCSFKTENGRPTLKARFP